MSNVMKKYRVMDIPIQFFCRYNAQKFTTARPRSGLTVAKTNVFALFLNVQIR